ncbi:hypothetical protein PG994_013894 [Apiospora phragmitis]|uniref:Uncharacterized protein n=1 Tax=Apiospora phragmitis TaxID=2905665 RepID=A0ABR1T2S8_9PEZI
MPSFLSTLLKEVELSTPSDDETVRTVLGVPKSNGEHSSPASSPLAFWIQQPSCAVSYAAAARNHVAGRSPESSPTRASPTRIALPLETKENISAITKAALKPHFRAGSINADQYTAINRDLSRKLYMQVPDEGLDHDTRIKCETLASKEVAKAVADLKTGV